MPVVEKEGVDLVRRSKRTQRIIMLYKQVTKKEKEACEAEVNIFAVVESKEFIGRFEIHPLFKLSAPCPGSYTIIST